MFWATRKAWQGRTLIRMCHDCGRQLASEDNPLGSWTPARWTCALLSHWTKWTFKFSSVEYSRFNVHNT